MADKTNKYPENVNGRFYVDTQCIDCPNVTRNEKLISHKSAGTVISNIKFLSEADGCDLCRQTAPLNFNRNEAGGYTYLSKQPQTPQEEALCEQAREECPVEAIGNDG